MSALSNKTTAIQEVDRMLQTNAVMLSTLYKISMLSGSDTNHVIHDFQENMPKIPETKVIRNVDRNRLGEIIASYGKDVDVARFFEERLETAIDFEKQRAYFADRTIARNFADIVVSQPQNFQEEILLVAATQFLEPHEFKNAILNKSPAEEVANLIDQSTVKRMTDNVINKIGHEKVEKSFEVASEPQENPLGKDFGILASIQNALEEIDIAAHQAQPQRDNGRGR